MLVESSVCVENNCTDNNTSSTDRGKNTSMSDNYIYRI